MKDKAQDETMRIEADSMDTAQCIERVQHLLRSVRTVASDYFNSTAVLELWDEVAGEGDVRVSWSIPLDLKTLGVVAAMVQAPLAFRGATDRGKTALAERILTGLFGEHLAGWWRIETNRGLSIDDLIDVDIRKLTQSKLSEAIAAARWLSLPARLLDEINRCHAKLLNLALHLADGSGFHVRGDLNLPVGMPYRVGSADKRYSFTIVTANHLTGDYSGTYEEDQAMIRRLVISVDLDELPPSTHDRARLLNTRRAKAGIPTAAECTREVVEVYEALPRVLEFSSLAYLFLHYLAGRSTCVQTRCGHLKPTLKPDICNKCHLAKAHRYCGRVGGLSEGLLLWVREVALALAAVRAANVLEQVDLQCRQGERSGGAAEKLQRVLKTQATGQELYEQFRGRYLAGLRVTGEDVKAAYVLVAPTHVWVDRDWLKAQAGFEGNPLYAFKEVAKDGWVSMLRFFQEHRELVGNLTRGGEISSADQNAIETHVTNQDAAILAVANALRDEELPLHFRRDVQAYRPSPTG